MFRFDKSLDLPTQLEWKYANEPELLGWTIKARNYNTFVANCMFAFLAFLLIGVTFFLDYADESIAIRATYAFGFYGVFILVTLSMTHQRANFAFRFTKSGIECCEWKDFPKWVLPFLKWLASITTVVFISLAAVDPAFLFGALIGPVGIGLTYFSMANSKSYQEMHTQYHHLIYEWKSFTQLAIATNREVVDLKFTHFNTNFGRVVSWSLNIFCKRKQKEHVANFIKPYLSPDVPFIRAKVDVPLSTV